MITLDDRVRHATKLADHLRGGVVSKAHYDMADRSARACIRGLLDWMRKNEPNRAPYLRAKEAKDRLLWIWLYVERDWWQRQREQLRRPV